MAFTNDLAIPKNQATRLLGYAFPICDIPSRSDTVSSNPRSLVICGIQKANTVGVYLKVQDFDLKACEGYEPDPDFCYDCSPLFGLHTIGQKGLKDYTGHTARQLIRLIRQAEGTLPEPKTGIPAGATAPLRCAACGHMAASEDSL